MLPASQSEQKKRHHSKSRSGCSTCKRRHFKCDERKPVCMRCTLTGLECEYNVPQPRLFPSPHTQIERNDPEIPSSIPQQLLAIPDPFEQRALAYFRERAGPRLTGFTSYTHIFWSQLIPQLCQSEEAVRHIVVAISTKYEAVVDSAGNLGETSAFLSKHYSLALQALTQPSMSLSEEILFVCCIALIAFERLQDPTGLDGRYLGHVSAGLRMLRERRERFPTASTQGDSFNLIDSLIKPIMVQIELLLSMFHQPEDIVGRSSLPKPKIPFLFADLRSARDVFFHICAWRYTLSPTGASWGPESTNYAEILALIKQWQQSFQTYLATIPSEDVEETRRALNLREQACALVGAMMFSVRHSAAESYCCQPVRVDLTAPSKVVVFMRVSGRQRVNLSGINGGRPAGLKANGLRLWPHAKRINECGSDDFVTLELMSSEVISQL